jgi:hypothetical protein
MNSAILSTLSKLNNALSHEYQEHLYRLKESVISSDSSSHRGMVMNIYSAFIFSTHEQGYSAIRILNDSYLFNQHFRLLIGFIYVEWTARDQRKYTYANNCKILFSALANEKQLDFNFIKLTIRVTEDVNKCIDEFRQLKLDKNKLSYLNGWEIDSKDGKSQQVNLDNIYCNFGMTFTNTIHTALKNYGATQKLSTLKPFLNTLKKIIDGFCLFPQINTVEALEHKLSSRNVHIFFNNIMTLQFSLSQYKGLDPRIFYRDWSKATVVYTDCFINTQVFDAPIKPFITPKWKEAIGGAPTFSIGGEPSEAERQRWFGGIDLHIKDDEAISLIQSRLDMDMNHIKHVCNIKFKELKERHERNLRLASEGKVKLRGEINKGFEIGPEYVKNTIATFYAHKFVDELYYTTFLGYVGKTKELQTELNLPNVSTLNVLVSLLVLEHPLITPSWLVHWELFDKNGVQKGFKQVGEQWIAVSYKDRKGAAIAQQEIILTEETKEVVEFLIEHTQMARDNLKKQCNTEWRKMIITATQGRPRILANLNSSLLHKCEFHNWLSDMSLLKKGSLLTESELVLISDIANPRSIRRHRGLQIYLETKSIHAVSEALGHKEVDMTMLSSYLPKPLLSFFNDRWIRQFQNAILLEAMKGSKYQFDAVDISAEKIEEFLENHGIRHIPNNFDHGFKSNSTSNSNCSVHFKRAAFTISTSLLQLLIAIKSNIESETDESDTLFKDICNDWYNAAVFILLSLQTDLYNEDEELMNMLHEAESSPLDANRIRGALIC